MSIRHVGCIMIVHNAPNLYICSGNVIRHDHFHTLANGFSRETKRSRFTSRRFRSHHRHIRPSSNRISLGTMNSVQSHMGNKNESEMRATMVQRVVLVNVTTGWLQRRRKPCWWQDSSLQQRRLGLFWWFDLRNHRRSTSKKDHIL